MQLRIPADGHITGEFGPELELDPRWEWTAVQSLGMPDRHIQIRCLHTEVVPVNSAVTGERIARLCRTCDQQLPA